MSNREHPYQDSSVQVGGSVTGSNIVTGDQNVVSLHYQQVSLPEPASVDMRAELAAIKEEILKLTSEHRDKMESAIKDAEGEVAKPKPDKDEVGKALERALDYAKKAEGFASTAEKLKTPIANAAAWLGENWHKILGVVGLVI
jgi:hypothetical protein